MYNPETEEKIESSNKQQEQLQMLLIIGIVGIGYYFFVYLSKKREEVKGAINKLFQQNSSITATDLDSNLWKNAENWEEYVDSLYLSSQINLFTREMKKEIIRLAEEEKEKPKKAREKAKEEVEDFAKKNWTKDELESEELQKKLKGFTKKIDKTKVDEISSIVSEANNFVVDIKTKRQGLHWKGKIHNWADRWLLIITMSNQKNNCTKCQKELNYLPCHSYAEPPALKSKEGELYCFDCFKSVSHCKVCGKSAAQIEINIHDKKTWYQPWEKVYWQEPENSKPFDMCGRYCDFLCSPECLANDDNRNHELRRRKNQEKLQQGWKYCEECMGLFEDLFAERHAQKEIKKAISYHAYVVPSGEKICKYHKKSQEKDLYINQVIYPKAQKWWDSLTYEEKLSEVKRLDINWITAEKRKATHEEVASRKEIPPFFISQEFEHKEPCTSCGKTWKAACEINCGKNSPNGKTSYCASCPPSTGNNGSENEIEDSSCNPTTKIEGKKIQLQKLKKERGENSEEVRKLESEIRKLVMENQSNLSTSKHQAKKNDMVPWVIGSLFVVVLSGIIITRIQQKRIKRR